MSCLNHPGIPAVQICEGCKGTYCSDCLVDINGSKYCAGCKLMAVHAGSMPEQGTLPCKEASEALKYAIVSIFCLGFILGPVAISKGLSARQQIARNHRLTGSGYATAAIIIGSVVLVLNIIGFIIRFSNI
jgi:hypothetical protein